MLSRESAYLENLEFRLSGLTATQRLVLVDFEANLSGVVELLALARRPLPPLDDRVRKVLEWLRGSLTRRTPLAEAAATGSLFVPWILTLDLAEAELPEGAFVWFEGGERW